VNQWLTPLIHAGASCPGREALNQSALPQRGRWYGHSFTTNKTAIEIVTIWCTHSGQDTFAAHHGDAVRRPDAAEAPVDPAAPAEAGRRGPKGWHNRLIHQSRGGHTSRCGEANKPRCLSCLEGRLAAAGTQVALTIRDPRHGPAAPGCRGIVMHALKQRETSQS
jgi:hypothetical protein